MTYYSLLDKLQVQRVHSYCTNSRHFHSRLLVHQVYFKRQMTRKTFFLQTKEIKSEFYKPIIKNTSKSKQVTAYNQTLKEILLLYIPELMYKYMPVSSPACHQNGRLPYTSQENTKCSMVLSAIEAFNDICL